MVFKCKCKIQINGGEEEKDMWLGYKLNERVDASSIDMTEIYLLVLITLTGRYHRVNICRLFTFCHAKAFPRGQSPPKERFLIIFDIKILIPYLYFKYLSILKPGVPMEYMKKRKADKTLK